MASFRLLCFLAVLSALALTIILFIVYVLPLTADGSLTYTRISGEPVNQIIIFVPLSEAGENIFKVSWMSAASAEGEWTVTPGHYGADRYPDYWVLSSPPLKSGEGLQVRFVMEHVRDIRYENYPWTVQADVVVSAPVTVYKHCLVTIVTLLEGNIQVIALTLGALIVTLTAIVVASALTKKAPLIAHLPERVGLVFQEGLPAEERKCVCKEWKYVCLRFFIVDECGGKNKSSNKKEGLLKGAEEAVERAKKELERIDKP